MVRLLASILIVTSLLAFTNGYCPERCMCLAETQVICTSVELESVHTDLPVTTQQLSLNKNQITTIKEDAFKLLRNLRKLDLDDNPIQTLEPYAFRGLHNLDEISVQGTELERLVPNSFSGVINVTYIYLGYNKIVAIDKHAFSGSKNIRNIVLTGNPIFTLHSNAFFNLSYVEYISLPEGIGQVEQDAFNGLSNVGQLTLSRLNCERFVEHTFRGLKHVTSLEIKDSNITDIDTRAFSGLSGVTLFLFVNNTVDIVSSHAFEGMHAVGAFYLAKNTFYDLEPNALSRIEEHVKKVNFTNNYVPCDCRLHWLIDTQKTLESLIRNDNLCAFPKEQKGMLTSVVDLAVLDRCPTDLPVILETTTPEDTKAPYQEIDGVVEEGDDEVEEEISIDVVLENKTGFGIELKSSHFTVWCLLGVLLLA